MTTEGFQAGTRVRINAPGWGVHGKTGTVRYTGGGVVDLDSGRVAAVGDHELVRLRQQGNASR